MRSPALAFAALALTLFAWCAPARAGVLEWGALPDESIADSLRSLGTSYEERWNRTLVEVIRSRSSGSELHAARGAAVLERIAGLEARVLRTRIASDAWAAVRAADDSALAMRVRAFEAESLRTWTSITEAVRLYRRIGERRRPAILLGTLGGLSNELAGRASGAQRRAWLERADSLYREANHERIALGDSVLIGRSLQSIALINRFLGRTAVAVDHYRAALAVRKESRQLDAATRTAFELAELLASGSGAREAIALSESLQAVATNPASVERIRKLRLEAFSKLARFDEAELEARAIQEAARAVGNAPGVLSAKLDLGRLLMRAYDDDEALPLLEEVRSKALRGADTAQALAAANNLAALLMRRGENRRARRLLGAAWDMAIRSDNTELARDLAITRAEEVLARGDVRGAARFFRLADSLHVLREGESRIDLLVNLGWASLFDGDIAGANDRFAAVLARARVEDDLEIMRACLLGLGESAQRAGRLDEAIRWDLDAVAVLDSTRARQRREGARVALVGERYDAYEAVIDLLGRKYATGDSAAGERAFEIAERSRARSLDDLLEANGVAPVRTSAITIGAVQRRLRPHAAMLYFSVGDSATTLWVIRASGWKSYRLARRAVMGEAVRALRSAWLHPMTSATARAESLAVRVGRLLFDKSRSELRNIRSLEIVGDDALIGLPFEALPLKSVDRSATPSAFLVDRFSVAYPPSARWFVEPHDVEFSSRIVALGDPRYGSRPPRHRGKEIRLARLVGSRTELESIVRLASSGRVTRLTDRHASWSALCRAAAEGPPRLVHLATHGNASSTRPDGVAIWFAPDSGEVARRVTIPEVLRSGLRGELVSLAACESGLGRFSRGEGVLGLPRVLLANGSRGVLSSSWSVDDEWTGRFFEEFYRFWLREGASAELALAEAKRAMIHRWGASSPYYWASFTLQGS